MLTLAIDTASAWSTVAVVEGDVVLEEAEHRDPRGHAEVLATLVSDVLARAGRPRIDVVACGVGPGPYTGLRIGVTTAQVLGLAWQAQVVGICSLDVIAADALAGGAVGPFVVVGRVEAGGGRECAAVQTVGVRPCSSTHSPLRAALPPDSAARAPWRVDHRLAAARPRPACALAARARECPAHRRPLAGPLAPGNRVEHSDPDRE